MRCVLHDWNDAHGKIILRNVRKAIGDASAVLVLVEVNN